MKRKILQKESYQPIWFNLQNIFRPYSNPKKSPSSAQKVPRKESNWPPNDLIQLKFTFTSINLTSILLWQQSTRILNWLFFIIKHHRSWGWVRPNSSQLGWSFVKLCHNEIEYTWLEHQQSLKAYFEKEK